MNMFFDLKMQILERSFGRQDVFYHLVQSYFSFFFRVVFFFFPPRWLAYTCHHRTWQSVGFEGYYCALSLSPAFVAVQPSSLAPESLEKNIILQ